MRAGWKKCDGETQRRVAVMEKTSEGDLKLQCCSRMSDSAGAEGTLRIMNTEKVGSERKNGREMSKCGTSIKSVTPEGISLIFFYPISIVSLFKMFLVYMYLHKHTHIYCSCPQYLQISLFSYHTHHLFDCREQEQSLPFTFLCCLVTFSPPSLWFKQRQKILLKNADVKLTVLKNKCVVFVLKYLTFRHHDISTQLQFRGKYYIFKFTINFSKEAAVAYRKVAGLIPGSSTLHVEVSFNRQTPYCSRLWFN